MHTDTIFPGTPVISFLQNVQLIVWSEYNSIPRDWLSSGSKFIDHLGSGRDRASLEIAFADLLSDFPEAPVANDVITNFVRSVTRLENIKDVVIHLPASAVRQRLALYWSPRLTTELESGLGPNLSTVEHVLEFRPHKRPLNWMRKLTYLS